MAITLVWMDSREAKIFHIESERIHAETFRFHEESNGEAEHHRFKALSEKINRNHFDRLLLMGPGVGPGHFEKYLVQHFSGVGEKIIGVEKVDHMPDSEILAAGRKFLHKYYLYQGMIN